MKKALLGIGLLAATFILFACKSDNDNGSDTIQVEYPDEEEDLYNFEALSLQPYGIDAIIYLPDETSSIGTSTSAEVLHELDGFEWEIMVGSNFHLTIEDWGDESFSEYIEDLDEQNIFDVEYLEKEDNFIYYKTTLKVKGKKNTKNIGTGHETFHVAAMHTINGVNYIFRTNKDGHSKKITDYMKKTVMYIKPLGSES